ncbi:MAG: sugar phosphate isomerase/epimerase [Lachnospiraceae bacterium]|jgi:sugar phosphate isomerase/epimerase|nr:sugar phosphate isomerase/epimerase [Lachnospiraceae bacterium]MDE7058378.1 sugar phosphate isomerase/epimerase [Lachnospiraceae bacterium]
MLSLGVQTKNIVEDTNPAEGFSMMKRAGFSCADFSLNYYLTNTSLYKQELNKFFDQSEEELEQYFAPHVRGAKEAGIKIHQMHMPYPLYIPGGKQKLNQYLQEVVAPKSLKVCEVFQCPYMVVHGFKLAQHLGSEEAEWQQTEELLHSILPMAKEKGIILCIENLYTGTGGHIVEGTCCNARKAAERIDRINQQYGTEVLGFCLDTGHANLVGLDFEDFIIRLGKRLKVLHVHDNDGIGDLHQIPFTFTKTRENKVSTDWDGFLRGLRAIEFDQVLSFETAPVLSAFPVELKEDALRLIARVGEYFIERIK